MALNSQSLDDVVLWSDGAPEVVVLRFRPAKAGWLPGEDRGDAVTQQVDRGNDVVTARTATSDAEAAAEQAARLAVLLAEVAGVALGHWYTVVAMGERVSRNGTEGVALRARKVRRRQALELLLGPFGVSGRRSWRRSSRMEP